MYRLVFEQPAARPAFSTRASLLLIGRAPVCQLRLLENGISDRHAAIERAADGYYIRDLHAATGVRVNDQPITIQRLATGDTVELGAVRMKFEILHQAAPPRRPFDLLQILAAVIIIGLLTGQVILFFHIFSVHRPRKMPMAAGSEPAGISLASPSGADAIPVITVPAATNIPSTAPVAPAPLGRLLRIQKISRADTANQVTLRVDVRAGAPERELDAAATAVTVQFHRLDGGKTVAQEVLSFRAPAWENFTVKTFAAQFNGAPSQLAGYVVRTYYRNQLQDERIELPAAGGTTTR